MCLIQRITKKEDKNGTPLKRDFLDLLEYDWYSTYGLTVHSQSTYILTGSTPVILNALLQVTAILVQKELEKRKNHG
jgi:hypothetical protein